MKKHLYTSLLLLLSVVTGAFSQSMIISGGADHALALCSKGQVYAWGANKGNRLCLADPTAAAMDVVPYPSLVNTGQLTFSQVSAGSGGHNVALSCYKVVYCWGGNDEMQCGRPKSDYITGGEPVPVYCGEAPGYTLDGQPGGQYLGNVKYITGTTAASLAILDDGKGSVVLWGGNLEGGGGVIKTPSSTPVYIKDPSGTKNLENVIHITGGDNNILLIVGDSPDAKVGTVYSLGNWNGRGGDGSASSDDIYVAAPVEIGDGTGTASSGKYLTNVRTSGLSDTGGMAVDGETGYVYAWGNNGWWGCGGVQTKYGSPMVYAEKVASGEYKTISGEADLTDVLQVVGGNGCAMAVTKEGRILYWGSNTAGKSTGAQANGGVIPNTKYASTLDDTKKNGPIFATYCKDVANGITEEKVIEDAVAIARGDLFGFLVNSKGDFYVWGSSSRPTAGPFDYVGALGLGKKEDLSTCFKKIEISCTPQDLCPEAYMLGPRYKCPGVEDSLYAGFTPLKNSENNYFYKWTKDGVVLNTSTSTSSLADRVADKYNKHTIHIVEPGTYRVDIYYVGANVPCDNCPDTYAEIEVIDMQMPIDTIITTACVPEDRANNPNGDDIIEYEFKVNSKLYKSGDKTTWIVYDDKETGVALDTLDIEVGEKGQFTVTGDHVLFNDNSPIDTTYSIWIEDATKFKGVFLEDAIDKTQKGSGQLSTTQPYYLHLNLYNSIALESFDVSFTVGWNNVKTTITPVIYVEDMDEANNGIPMAGKVYAKCKPYELNLEGGSNTPKLYTETIDMGGVVLEANPARGSRYYIFFEVSDNVNDLIVSTTTAPLIAKIGTNEIIIDGLGKANSKSNFGDAGSHFIENLVISKVTDYTCGRIELTSKLKCPPCNQPDGIIKIEVDGTAHANAKDTIALCEESDPIVLSVSGIAKASEPTAKFDELWFIDKIGTDATAERADLAKTSSALPAISWSAAKAGKVETYYVKIRDNEKPTSALCYKFDSIYVKYNEKPVAPAIDPIAFCENATDKTALKTALAGTDFDGFTVNWYADAAKSAPGSEPDLTTLAAKATAYEFYYMVTNDETGCESEVATVEVTVYALPVDPLEALDPFCKGDATVSLLAASPVEAYTVTWYGDATGTTKLTSTDLSVLAAGTYDYSYTLTSAAPQSCTNDPVAYTFVVKDSTTIVIDTTMSCGKTDVTEATLLPSGATVSYTLDGQSVSTTSYTNPTYLGSVGSLIATAEATGYCTNTSNTIALYVKEEAASVTGSKSVKYLKTDAVNGAFPKNLIEQSAATDPVVIEQTGYTFNWYADNAGAAGAKLAGCPTPDVPTGDEDVTVKYWVSQVNADGCESEKVLVTVDIFATPVPNAKNLEYCKNSPNVTDLFTAGAATVNGDASKFHLEWIDVDGTEKGTTAPTPVVTAAGEYVYKVYQVSTENAKSSTVDIKVTVYDVMEPTLAAENVYGYCAASALSSPLVANIQKNEATKYMASSIVWSQEQSDGTYGEILSPVVSLNVKNDTTYNFKVHQTYEVSATEKCLGPDITASVDVTYVPAPTVSGVDVIYLKADANADGSFSKNVLEQAADAATTNKTGATLVWYEEDCSTPITGVPSPKLDLTLPEGEDDYVTFCVRQKVGDCESEPKSVRIKISDALPPTPYAYHYCEGETMEDLKAEKNPQPGNTLGYTLLWYASNPASTSTATPDGEGDTYSMSGQIASVTGGAVTTLTYYVAQKDNGTGAISNAQPVNITIYPKPVVTTYPVAPVCEQEVNMDVNTIRNVTNVTEPITYTYGFNGAQGISSLASVSGSYTVTPSYMLPVTTSSTYTVIVPTTKECVGMAQPIDIQIHDLTVPDYITGDPSTCPGTSIHLEVDGVQSNSHSASEIVYTWGDDATTTIAPGAPANQSSFDSGSLSTLTGTIYTYSATVTAGACTKPVTNKHTVVIDKGVVSGNIIFTEVGNSYSGNVELKNGVRTVEFSSCGESVNMQVAFLGDNDYVWYKNGQQIGTGDNFVTPSYASNDVSVYTLKFTNTCPTEVEVTINTVPLSTVALTTEPDVMCEGTRFETKLQYVLDANGQVPSIQWYRTKEGGTPKLVAENNNQASTYNDATAKTSSFFINRTMADDSGEYSYVAKYMGCTSEGVTNKLQVKEYIKSNIVVPGNDPDVQVVRINGKDKPIFIVDRHATKTVAINIDVPSYREAESISWLENGVQTATGSSNVLTDLTTDHLYSQIILSDPEYCSDTLMADVLVDAELQLKTFLNDTLCYGLSDTLVIDTTGTGAFRRVNGNPRNTLTCYIAQNDGTEKEIDLSDLLNDTESTDGLIRVKVDPTDNARYVVKRSYNGKDIDATESVVVIEAIRATIPTEVPVICEGMDTVLMVSNVGPEKTTITWMDMDNDATIIEGKNSETVRVKPIYRESADHQSQYTYTVIAYNSICDRSKSWPVTVKVDEPLKGEITGVAEICQGDKATFDAAIYEASTYMWSSSDSSAVMSDKALQEVSPNVSSSYFLEMTRGRCTAKDTFVVTVHSNPVVTRVDSIALRDRKIILDPSYGQAPFTYAIDAQPADGLDEKYNLTFANHVVYVTDANDCKTSYIFKMEAPGISIPEYFTPNNNGTNDTWKIPNIADVYPNAIIKIFDRFGKVVAEFLGADAEGWDGTYKGKALPSTDYWYQVTIDEINREYVGHFTLLRR